jgi:hypothetical protein
MNVKRVTHSSTTLMVWFCYMNMRYWSIKWMKTMVHHVPLMMVVRVKLVNSIIGK